MFTGIIEELGIVKRVSRLANVTLLEISAVKITEGVRVGDSVAINGVCLTVVKIGKDSFSFEVISETLKITNLGILRINEKVNLERSLKIGDRISGHFCRLADCDRAWDQPTREIYKSKMLISPPASRISSSCSGFRRAMGF